MAHEGNSDKVAKYFVSFSIPDVNGDNMQTLVIKLHSRKVAAFRWLIASLIISG